MTNNYDPYRHGLDGTTGSSSKCPTCGIKAANQHTLREAGECDGIKRQRRLEAEARAKAAAKRVAA